MDPILIFGHKNPDTDSICSAIALAELKKLQGIEAVPCRLGDLSKETEYVLNYFGVRSPRLLKTVSAQISDLQSVEKSVISINDSLKTALSIMTEENFSSLPVVDEKKHLKGMIHVSDIANAYIGIEHSDLFQKYFTTYENLKSVLKGEIISGNYPSGKIEGNLKAVSELEAVTPGDIVVTTSMVDGIDRSIKAGAKVIIICCTPDDFISPRTHADCAIMRVNDSLFKTVSLISQSISISSILKGHQFYSFKIDDFLNEIKDIMKEANQSNFPVVDKHGKVYGTIRTKNLINFSRKKVILVDHNERTQSVDGLRDARILQVVDHHKFGNFETEEPLRIDAAVVGSCCTIVYGLYKDAGLIPEKKIAGLLLSAILSDTLITKSPTCTDLDRIAINELAAISGIEDYEKYGMNMLIAGTSLGDKSAMEILNNDMKEFSMGNLKVAVAQINTVDVNGILVRKRELEDVMLELNKEHGYNLFILAITDIIKSDSLTLSVGNAPSLLEKAFNVKIENNLAWLKGVVSRKKQLIPFLMAASQSME
jgi:manganese-dependent inorganic pyrophosphatase